MTYIMFPVICCYGLLWKDGNRLQLEKFILNFLSFDAMSTTNTKKSTMGCTFFYNIKKMVQSLR